MSRRITSFLVFFLVFLPTLVWPQSERFKVGGEITFTKTGNLYIELVTRQEFDSDKPSSFRLILKLSPADINKGKTSFTFQNVRQGTYGIQCFQDVNGNGRLDHGMFGAKEPWGVYLPVRPRFRGPKFDEIGFMVGNDTTEIRIEVE